MNDQERLEKLLREIHDDLDKRISWLENSVRALEDARLANKVLEAERARVASDTATALATAKSQTVSKWELRLAAIGITVAAVAPQIAALISHLN